MKSALFLAAAITLSAGIVAARPARHQVCTVILPRPLIPDPSGATHGAVWAEVSVGGVVMEICEVKEPE
jgi:hypothetical protein